MDLWTQTTTFIRDHPAAAGGILGLIAIPVVLAAPAVATIAAFIGGAMGIGEALGNEEKTKQDKK